MLSVTAEGRFAPKAEGDPSPFPNGWVTRVLFALLVSPLFQATVPLHKLIMDGNRADNVRRKRASQLEVALSGERCRNNLTVCCIRNAFSVIVRVIFVTVCAHCAMCCLMDMGIVNNPSRRASRL